MSLFKHHWFRPVLALSLAWGMGKAVAVETAPVLVRWHFVGADALANLPEAAKQKEIFTHDLSVELREVVLEKLAAAPGQLLQKRVPAGTDGAAWMRPVFDDLWQVESAAEWNENGGGDFVLAAKLSPERSALWSTNLWQAVQAWSGNAPQAANGGWTAVAKASGLKIRLQSAGAWTLLGVGPEKSELAELWSKTILATGGPGRLAATNWLGLELNWPKLQARLPHLELPFKPAEMTVTWGAAKAGNTRLVVQARYAEVLPGQAKSWNIPAQIIHEPLISFTAGQGLDAIFPEPPSLRGLSVRPWRDQYYLWASSAMPFFIFSAMPVKDGPATLRSLAKELPQTFNARLQAEKQGSFVTTTNGHVKWQGLSLVGPEIAATNLPGGDFLFAALMPPSPSKHNAPAELFDQVSRRTNLVYYDWEITSTRVGQWQVLSTVLPVLGLGKLDASRAHLDANPERAEKQKRRLRLDVRWPSAIGQMLGNSVTEITRTGPKEATLTRKSELGLTSLEMVILARHLTDPAFPLFGRELPATAQPK